MSPIAILPDWPHLALFLPAMVAITLLPGPDMLFIAAQALRGGRRHGLICVAGIAAGLLVHTTLAALGLSALLLRSATAFTVVKELGAAYLIFLGLRTLLSRDAQDALVPPKSTDGREAAGTRDAATTERGSNAALPVRTAWRGAFAAGFVTNVLNPKVVLFMLAFMPQFIDPTRGHVGLQLAALGLIWESFGVLVLSAVVMTASAFDALRKRFGAGRRHGRLVTGGIFLGLGIRVAIPDAR